MKFSTQRYLTNILVKFEDENNSPSCLSESAQDHTTYAIAMTPTDHSIITQVLAGLSAGSFHFATGAVFGFSAILIPQLEAHNSEIKVTKEDISWIASVTALVMPVGAPVTGYLVDRIGRINTIIAGAVPFILGWICIALAQGFPMLLFGRLLTGFSTAMSTSPALVYITEIARPDLRGALMCMAPAMTSLGMVVMYSKGALLYWRTVAWLTIAYCVFPVLFVILWSPESPVWLVSRGRAQDARKSLTFLLRREKKAGLADQQLSELLREHNNKQGVANQKGSSFRKLVHGLARPTGFKPLLLLTVIFGFQQFSGIYITIFYAVSFFEVMGANINPYVSSIGVGLVRLVIGLLTSFLMGSFGRRPLFLLSGAGMALFMFVSGYITKQVAAGTMEPSYVPVICILMYMSLGVIGLLSIPWTMTAELFPLEIRGMAQAIVISLGNILMFIALKIYPFLIDMLGGAYGVQWLFAGVSLASVIFIFIFLPETHKKQLKEIQGYFEHHTIYLLRKEKSAEREDSKEVGEEIMKLKDAAPV